MTKPITALLITEYCTDCYEYVDHELWTICLETQCLACGRVAPVSESYVIRALADDARAVNA